MAGAFVRCGHEKMSPRDRNGCSRIGRPVRRRPKTASPLVGNGWWNCAACWRVMRLRSMPMQKTYGISHAWVDRRSASFPAAHFREPSPRCSMRSNRNGLLVSKLPADLQDGSNIRRPANDRRSDSARASEAKGLFFYRWRISRRVGFNPAGPARRGVSDRGVPNLLRRREMHSAFRFGSNRLFRNRRAIQKPREVRHHADGWNCCGRSGRNGYGGLWQRLVGIAQASIFGS